MIFQSWRLCANIELIAGVVRKENFQGKFSYVSLCSKGVIVINMKNYIEHCCFNTQNQKFFLIYCAQFLYCNELVKVYLFQILGEVIHIMKNLTMHGVKLK